MKRFFLFEAEPHCFLAVHADVFQRLKLIYALKTLKHPEFISHIGLAYDTKDDSDDVRKMDWRYFTNILCAHTEMLFADNKPYPKHLKKFPYRTYMHVIHCMANQVTGSRPAEVKIYSDMHRHYNPKHKRYKKHAH